MEGLAEGIFLMSVAFLLVVICLIISPLFIWKWTKRTANNIQVLTHVTKENLKSIEELKKLITNLRSPRTMD
jgi:hypothetical protein